MKAKNELIKKATELSKRGLSVRQIAKELNCSKSSVSRWLMDQENNEEDEDCLCPYCATDKAMVDLIKALQTSSYHMNDNFNRTASHILLELMSNLVIGFNEDGSYATEKDLVSKLLRLSRIHQNGAIYHHIHDEVDELCDFYEDLSGSAIKSSLK